MPTLDQEKTRYFQYVRPRYSNPTFSSDNMGTSLFPKLSGPLYLSRSNHMANKFQRGNPQLHTDGYKHLNPQKKQSLSHLSNYGSSSLGKLPKYTPNQQFNQLVGNQRDIYERQQKKYNIISMLPKSYNETIKKYPKYHLENNDGNFYKKLLLEDQYRTAGIQSNRSKMSSGHIEQNPKFYTKNQQLNSKQHQSQKIFRPKMLNNVDDLGGVV